MFGGNGFIGSHFVCAMLAYGHKIRVVDRYPERFRDPIPKVDYRIGAFNDTFMISEALSNIDVVCHLISTTVPSTSNHDPAEDIRSNLINTVQLLDQMRKKDIKRIVFLSSGGTVYGIPKHLPIVEEHPLDPICSYGIVKVAIEKYLYMYQHLYGFEPLILRPSNIFGPGQARQGIQGLIGTFLGQIIDDKPLEVWGNGEVVRDYIFIEDFVRLFVSAVESTVTGIFNVGSGKGYSVNEVVKVIRQMIEPDTIPVKYIDAQTYDVPAVVLDIRNVQQKFTWQPKVNLEDGIRTYFEWVSVNKRSDR